MQGQGFEDQAVARANVAMRVGPGRRLAGRCPVKACLAGASARLHMQQASCCRAVVPCRCMLHYQQCLHAQATDFHPEEHGMPAAGLTA